MDIEREEFTVENYPDTAFVITREPEQEAYRDVYGEDPDPDSEYFWVKVIARRIVDGKMYEGSDAIGFVDYRPGDSFGDVNGYRPDLINEALRDLESAITRGIDGTFDD